jgi:Na+/melibiose symporter-like transporter
MLNLRFFRDRRFSVASGGMTLIFFAMFGTFFLVSQYFQLVLGYSPLVSGLFQLPMAVMMMVMAPQAPGLVARFGVHRVVPTGLVCISIGLTMFSQMDVGSSIWLMYGPLLFLGAGMSIVMSPLTALIMSSVTLGKAGVGSAMNDTTRELGGALGVAVLGSLVTSTYTASISGALGHVSDANRHLAETGLVGSFNVARGIGGAGGAALREAAKHAFMDGVQVATLTGATVVALAAVAGWRLLPRTMPALAELPTDDVDDLDELGEVLPVPG